MTFTYGLAVAVGGAIGALARAGVAALLPSAAGFPFATFSVNGLGSLAIGVCWAATSRWHIDPIVTAFLMTGLLGGFTTFSTFSLDSLQLLMDGHYATALAYMLLSVTVCIAGAAIGIWFMRFVG